MGHSVWHFLYATHCEYEYSGSLKLNVENIFDDHDNANCMKTSLTTKLSLQEALSVRITVASYSPNLVYPHRQAAILHACIIRTRKTLQMIGTFQWQLWVVWTNW